MESARNTEDRNEVNPHSTIDNNRQLFGAKLNSGAVFFIIKAYQLNDSSLVVKFCFVSF